jgi:hypothetical protein
MYTHSTWILSFAPQHSLAGRDQARWGPLGAAQATEERVGSRASFPETKHQLSAMCVMLVILDPTLDRVKNDTADTVYTMKHPERGRSNQVHVRESLHLCT